MRVIVTGGCGFIGSSFVHLLYEQGGFDILVVDKLTYAGNKDNIPADVPLLVKDICDVTAEDLGEFEYLVNFAAETHVDNSIEDGRPFVRTNVEGTFNLLEIARKNPFLEKFVQISTDEVYGDLYYLKVDKSTETDDLKPSSYYSATKAAADLLVQSTVKTYSNPFALKWLITRTCNNFGVRQHEEKMIPKIIKCIKEGKEIPVYGDGQQQREWIWVEDNVQIIYQLMLSFATGIYNIGSGDVLTNMELIPKMKFPNYPRPRVEFVEDRKGHDRRYALDTTKLKQSIGNKLPRNKSVITYIFEQLREDK